MSVPLGAPASVFPTTAPDRATLDRALAGTIVLAFVVLFLAPSRFFYVPFPYQGDYGMFVPVNLIDLLCLGVALPLTTRVRITPGRGLAALGTVFVLGGIGLSVVGEAGPEQIGDLLLFNIRILGGLSLGSLLARSGLGAAMVAQSYLAGALAVSLSTLALATVGGLSYDFYRDLGRYGSLGMSPNETAGVLAGAFNMLPALMRKRRILALAAPLLLLAVFLTGSRTGLLLVMAGAIWWIPGLVGSMRGFKGVLVWFLILLVGAAAAWWASGLLQSLQTSQGIASVSQRTFNTGEDESSLFRLTIYAEALRYLQENPIVLLTGVGGSNAAVEWILMRVLPLGTTHTHNLALQVLMAYGVAGLVGATLLLLPLFRRAARFPDSETGALRVFALTVLASEALQYGLGEEKFLLLFTVAVGFVAAATARIGRPVGAVSLEANA